MTTGQYPRARQAPDDYLSFSAEVVPHTAEALIAAMTNCAAQSIPRVHLLLSSAAESEGAAVDWRAFHGREDDDLRSVVVLCPDCAGGEFGNG